MLRLKVLYFLLLLNLSINSNGQILEKGFVVTNSNDTLHGFIKYKDWTKNPTSIIFQKLIEGKDSQSLFSIKDIQYFEVIGLVKYKKYLVAVESTTSQQECFLKVLKTGKNISLLKFQDNQKDVFYILLADKVVPEELIFKKAQDGGSLAARERYKFQLVSVASKLGLMNANVEKRILNLEYTEGNLSKIVNELNGVSTKDSVNVIAPGIYFGGDLVSGTLHYKGKDFPLDNGKNEQHISPFIILGFDFRIIPKQGKVVIRTEFGFGISKFGISAESVDISGIIIKAHSELKQTNGRIAIQVLYNYYNRKKIKLYLLSGFCNNLVSLSSSDNIYTITKTYPTYSFTQQTKGYPDLSSNILCFPIKAGLLISNRYELCAGYVPSLNTSSNSAFSASFRYLELGFRFHFM